MDESSIRKRIVEIATTERCNHDIQELEQTISDLKEQLKNKEAELTALKKT
jgi:hypothetical protein